MADKRKIRNITFSVTNFEYDDILMYARLKGHGSENPISNLARYAVFQYLRRYPLKAHEIEKYQQDMAKQQKSSRLYSPNRTRANKKTSKKPKTGSRSRK